MDEIEYGESRDGCVSSDGESREKTADILVAGADPHFIVQQGMECNYKWILCKTKENLKSKIKLDSMAQLLDDQDANDLDQIIARWSDRKQRKMTFRLLYTLLKHPGIIHNERAARLLENMLKQTGHQVNLKLLLMLILHRTSKGAGG